MTAPRTIRLCAFIAAMLVTGAVRAASEVLSAARLGQTFAVLVAIIAAIFGLAYLVRRMPGLHARTGGVLKVVDALSLGSRERIVLIEIDRERLVLAVGPGKIECLHVVGGEAPRGNFKAALTEAGAAP